MSRRIVLLTLKITAENADKIDKRTFCDVRYRFVTAGSNTSYTPGPIGDCHLLKAETVKIRFRLRTKRHLRILQPLGGGSLLRGVLFNEGGARKTPYPPFFYWSGRWDSNPRRPAWEADILPLNYARIWEKPFFVALQTDAHLNQQDYFVKTFLTTGCYSLPVIHQSSRDCHRLHGREPSG